MKSFTFRTLGELVALAGVIFSLIFVGLELRQTRIASRAAAYQELGLGVSGVWLQLAQDRELNDLVMGLRSIDDYQALNASDQWLIQSFMIGVLRQYETAYLQVEEGLLDSGALEALGWAQVKENGVALWATWPEINGWVTPSFATYLVESGYIQK